LRLLIDGDNTVREGHIIAHRIEDIVKEKYPNIIHISTHVEPTYEIIE
jgi:divalent metal cation (Fe/Co/Zn/Cd) transporter